MNVKDTITQELKNALKSGDKLGLSVLRALKTSLQNKALEKGSIDAEISETEMFDVIRRQIKQREDSIESFNKSKRDDIDHLIEKEQSEITFLKKYLPAPISLEKIQELITSAITETQATSRKDMGKIINIIKEKTKGAIDNKTLSQEIIKKLG